MSTVYFHSVIKRNQHSPKDKMLLLIQRRLFFFLPHAVDKHINNLYTFTELLALQLELV